MTFVFPVLLGGLVLAGVPLVLHLIMRQKPKTLPFPAFRFLVQRQRTNLRKLRLRHILLMALRMLLIALLCLALGQPRIVHEGLGLTSDRPVAAVLVFDTSLSMEYQASDKTTRLDEAKKRGHAFLGELPPGSMVVVLDTADTARVSRAEWISSMSRARERIQALRPRPASASVLETLETAYRALAELARASEDDSRHSLPRLVCVFSDRTRACWDVGKLAAAQAAADQVSPTLEGLQQARDHIAPLVQLLKDLRGQLPPPPAQDYPEQVLIAHLEQLTPLLPALTSADFPVDDKLLALTTSIQARGRDLLRLLLAREKSAEPNEGYRAKLVKNLQEVLQDVRGAHGLFIDVGIDQPIDMAITHLKPPETAGGLDQIVFGPRAKFRLLALVQATGKDMNTTITCKLDGKNLHQQPVELKAGERQSIAFEVDCEALGLEPGQHQVEARFDTPDLLSFDNRRFLTFAVRQPRRVLVLARPEDHAKAGEFMRALKATGFAGDMRDLGALPTTDIRTYQAVYLFEVPSPSPAVWEFLFADCVRQGIGVGIIPAGTETDMQAYQGPAALRIMPGSLTKTVSAGIDGKTQGAVWNLADDNVYQHPLMRPFRGWRDNDLVKNPSEAFSFWEVKPHDKESLVVVSYNDAKKSPALIERRVSLDKGKSGKILLFTTRMEAEAPRWNNYLESKTSMYVVLVGLATSYLAGETEAPRLNFLSGQDEPIVALPTAARYSAYSLLGPDDLQQLAAPEGRSEWKLSTVQTPGNYVLEGLAGEGDSRRVAAFSVNVPAEESDLSRVSAGDIENLLGAGAVIADQRHANIRDLLKGRWSEPLELFPLFMVLLLLVLALENLLANKFYRREPEA